MDNSLYVNVKYSSLFFVGEQAHCVCHHVQVHVFSVGPFKLNVLLVTQWERPKY